MCLQCKVALRHYFEALCFALPGHQTYPWALDPGCVLAIGVGEGQFSLYRVPPSHPEDKLRWYL